MASKKPFFQETEFFPDPIFTAEYLKCTKCDQFVSINEKKIDVQFVI